MRANRDDRANDGDPDLAPMQGAPYWRPDHALDAAGLLRLAHEQFGVLTLAQARSGGLTERRIAGRVAAGQWIRLHHGVYLIEPGRTQWHTRAVAGLLACGSGAALVGGSAAYLWGLASTPSSVEIAVPLNRRLDPKDGVAIRRSAWIADRTHELAWPWRTTVEHTVLDVAATRDLDAAIAIAARATQRRLTTARALMTVLEQRGRHRWRRELGEALAVVSGGAESILEVRYVRDVEQAHGLPRGVAQVSSATGMPWRHDIGYPPFRVLVELDGRLGHEGRSRVADTRRDRGNAAAGWLTLRAGWLDVTTAPCPLAAEVGAVLQSRGWGGRPRRCRRRGCLAEVSMPRPGSAMS